MNILNNGGSNANKTCTQPHHARLAQKRITVCSLPSDAGVRVQANQASADSAHLKKAENQRNPY